MPPTGVLLLNPSAGPSDTDGRELTEAFPDAEIVVLDHDDTDGQLRRLLAGEPAWVAVAGGDGTIRSVAQVLAGTGTPLLPVPAGTRNHFALTLGVEDFDLARQASMAPPCRIDIGDVNGLVFINNAGIGLYPQMVQTREDHQRLLPKWAAQITAGAVQLRRAERVELTLDGRAQLVWLLFVGNNCYGESLSSLGERASLAEGVLDIRAVRADPRLARLRFATDIAVGHLGRSPMVLRQRADRFSVTVDRPEVEVSLDGEVFSLPPALEYRSRPGGLLVHAAPGWPVVGRSGAGGARG